MASTAWTTACRPEPHTRLTVSPGTSFGSPALSAACRATFMPAPACSTQPRMTTSTSLFKCPYLAGNDERRAGCRLHAFHRGVRRDLPQHEPVRRHLDDGKVRDDQVHDLQAGERQRAAIEDLVAAVFRRVLH